MFGCSEDDLNLLIFFIVPYFPPNLASSETRLDRFYGPSLGRPLSAVHVRAEIVEFYYILFFGS